MKSKYRLQTKVWIGVELVLLPLLLFYLFISPQIAVIFLVITLYDLKSRCDIILLDENGVTIKNWFTMEKVRYEYYEFDRMVKYLDPIETLGRLRIYLLKDAIIFCKINGHNYENLNELIFEINRKVGLGKK